MGGEKRNIQPAAAFRKKKGSLSRHRVKTAAPPSDFSPEPRDRTGFRRAPDLDKSAGKSPAAVPRGMIAFAVRFFCVTPAKKLFIFGAKGNIIEKITAKPCSAGVTIDDRYAG